MYRIIFSKIYTTHIRINELLYKFLVETVINLSQLIKKNLTTSIQVNR